MTIPTLLDTQAPPSLIRHLARIGAFRDPTSGLCPDHVQANLLVLPAKHRDDFLKLCLRNPVSCPLLGVTRAPGDPRMTPRLGMDSDVRTDAPGYNIYLDGKLVHHDIPDVLDFWRHDSVGFLIGCSFTFESALISAGLPPRHTQQGRNVPMYKTSFKLVPAGIFHGTMVVSMRPYKIKDVERVRDITRPYGAAHGEPVAWGYDGLQDLGINDLMEPEFGDAPSPLADDEVPVFWGCGVTPQQVIMASSCGGEIEGFVMAHAPGKMICLDLAVKDIL